LKYPGEPVVQAGSPITLHTSATTLDGTVLAEGLALPFIYNRQSHLKPAP
jgi:hypothetical protein